MSSIPINIFSSICYWRKSELQAIHTEIYIPRKEGGRGLISIEDCVELAIRGLEVYVHGSEEKLMQAARDKEKEKIRRLGGESST